MRAWVGWVGVGLLVGCGPKVEIDADGDSASSGSTSDAGTTSDSVSETSPLTTENPTTEPPPPPPSTTANPSGPDPATTASDSSGIIVDDFGSGGGLPHGAQCDEDGQCASGSCYVLGVLGGICGECTLDEQCPDGGCSLPNPLSDPAIPSMCNSGMLGEHCQSPDACNDPTHVCAEIIEVPGVLTVSSCSECFVDADCGPGLLCNPFHDLAQLQAVQVCVPSGSVPLAGGCDFEGTGDMACMSGFCEPADVMGLLTLGVCSECSVDTDCPDGSTCMPPEIDLQTGNIAGFCS